MARTRFTGEWCTFRWFQANDLSLRALIDAIPELKRERFVVVTALDSAPLHLSAGDLAAGWRQVGSLAISPKSPPLWTLPRGEWAEWYLFDEAPSMRAPEVFVNYTGFSLRTESGNEWQLSAVDRFWGQ